MPIMFREWLPSYSDLGGIAAVLNRISCFRVKRAKRLGEGAEALSRHYGGLYGDFRKFFPELLAFSEIRSHLGVRPKDGKGSRKKIEKRIFAKK
jgi:acyl carrier protein phosphodiesterase